MDYEIMMNGNVRIGQRAPDFEAMTTMGNISLNDYKGKWVILFSHPGDFTPVKSYNLGKYKKAWYCLIFSALIVSLILYFNGTESIVERLVRKKKSILKNNYEKGQA